MSHAGVREDVVFLLTRLALDKSSDNHRISQVQVALGRLLSCYTSD